MNLRNLTTFLLLFWLGPVLGGGAAAATERKLQVVTSLFPLYDFARQVGGGKTDVYLLLPPGVEAHDFEPKPVDMLRINKADIFIFTGKFMEPWAANLAKGTDNKNQLLIDASLGIDLLRDRGQENGVDPHIWMDFGNAQRMVDTIAAGFTAVDPSNGRFYKENAVTYKKQLQALDQEYKQTLARCRQKVMIGGGHFVFGYWAKRYNLRYLAAYRGFSTDAEPTVKDLLVLIDNIKKNRVKYIFYEELINPKVAGTLAQETGAGLLKLSSAHNLTKDEMDKKLTFLQLMEENLVNLKVGLEWQ